MLILAKNALEKCSVLLNLDSILYYECNDQNGTNILKHEDYP